MKPKRKTPVDWRSRKDRRVMGRSRAVLRALDSARCVSLVNGSAGYVKVGRGRAILTIEPDAGSNDNWVRVEMPVKAAPLPQVALDSSAQLPGNARYAHVGGETVLVADTRTDGVAHLPRSLHEVRYGFGQATGYGRRWRLQPQDIDADSVTKTIDGIAREKGATLDRVDREDGWELRPRVDGTPIAVFLSIEEGGLRIRKSFGPLLFGVEQIENAEDSDPGDRALAVATEALRLNGRLRLSRIVHADGELMVETVLHDEVIDASWIVTAARAVAVAFTQCRDPLRVLAEDLRVARCYLQMFLENPQSSSPRERELQCKPRRPSTLRI